MKTLLLSFALLFTAFSVIAQDSTGTKIYKNEFGLDMTGFIRQFLNISDQFGSYYQYQPAYYLTYRRLLSNTNVRAAFGFEYSSEEAPGYFMGDSSSYEDMQSKIAFRVGYEKFAMLEKRWEVLYGLDFRANFFRDMDENTGSNAGYMNGHDDKTIILGLAPFLGFRFKIGKRLSLTTEASLNCNVQKSTSRSSFKSVPGFSLPPKEDEIEERNRVFFEFSPPLAIFINFSI
ncbi:MAG TPA: hypothetical protein PK228_04715 [Saprospiraceae bacterium]|nr:hypothetical protein [Saprospiraceae bacterium]